MVRDNQENIIDIRQNQNDSSLFSLWNALIPKISLARRILLSAVGDVLDKKSLDRQNPQETSLRSLHWRNTEKSVWTLRTMERRKGSPSNIYINPSVLKEILALDKELASVLDDLKLSHDEKSVQLLGRLLSGSRRKLALASRKSGTMCLKKSSNSSCSIKNVSSVDSIQSGTSTISFFSDDSISAKSEKETPTPKKNLVIKCKYGSNTRKPIENIVQLLQSGSACQILPSPCQVLPAPCEAPSCDKKKKSKKAKKEKKAKKKKSKEKVKKKKSKTKKSDSNTCSECSTSQGSDTSVKKKKKKQKKSKKSSKVDICDSTELIALRSPCGPPVVPCKSIQAECLKRTVCTSKPDCTPCGKSRFSRIMSNIAGGGIHIKLPPPGPNFRAIRSCILPRLCATQKSCSIPPCGTPKVTICEDKPPCQPKVVCDPSPCGTPRRRICVDLPPCKFRLGLPRTSPCAIPLHKLRVRCPTPVCSPTPCSAPITCGTPSRISATCGTSRCDLTPCSPQPQSCYTPCSPTPCRTPPVCISRPRCTLNPCSPPPCSSRPCTPPPCGPKPCTPPPCRSIPCDPASPPPCSSGPCSPPPCGPKPCTPPPCGPIPCTPPPCGSMPCTPPPCESECNVRRWTCCTPRRISRCRSPPGSCSRISTCKSSPCRPTCRTPRITPMCYPRPCQPRSCSISPCSSASTCTPRRVCQPTSCAPDPCHTPCASNPCTPTCSDSDICNTCRRRSCYGSPRCPSRNSCYSRVKCGRPWWAPDCTYKDSCFPGPCSRSPSCFSPDECFPYDRRCRRYWSPYCSDDEYYYPSGRCRRFPLRGPYCSSEDFWCDKYRFPCPPRRCMSIPCASTSCGPKLPCGSDPCTPPYPYPCPYPPPCPPPYPLCPPPPCPPIFPPPCPPQYFFNPCQPPYPSCSPTPCSSRSSCGFKSNCEVGSPSCGPTPCKPDACIPCGPPLLTGKRCIRSPPCLKKVPKPCGGKPCAKRLNCAGFPKPSGPCRPMPIPAKPCGPYPYSRGCPPAACGSPVTSCDSFRQPCFPSPSCSGSNYWPYPSPSCSGYPYPYNWSGFYPGYGGFPACFPSRTCRKPTGCFLPFSNLKCSKFYQVSCDSGLPKYGRSRSTSEVSTTSCSTYSSSCSSRDPSCSSCSSSTSCTKTSNSLCVANCRSPPAYLKCTNSRSTTSVCSSLCNASSTRICNDNDRCHPRREPCGSPIACDDLNPCENLACGRCYENTPCGRPADCYRSQVCSSCTDFRCDSTLRCQGIRHYDDRIRFELKKIGINQLIKASKPAKCCRQTVLNQPSKEELPYAASLASLPLDRTDIRVIKQSVRMATQKKDYTSLENRTKLVYYANLVTDDFCAKKPKTKPQFEIRYFHVTLNDTQKVNDAMKQKVKNENIFRTFQILNCPNDSTLDTLDSIKLGHKLCLNEPECDVDSKVYPMKVREDILEDIIFSDLVEDELGLYLDRWKRQNRSSGRVETDLGYEDEFTQTIKEGSGTKDSIAQTDSVVYASKFPSVGLLGKGIANSEGSLEVDRKGIFIESELFGVTSKCMQKIHRSNEEEFAEATEEFETAMRAVLCELDELEGMMDSKYSRDVMSPNCYSNVNSVCRFSSPMKLFRRNGSRKLENLDSPLKITWSTKIKSSTRLAFDMYSSIGSLINEIYVEAESLIQLRRTRLAILGDLPKDEGIVNSAQFRKLDEFQKEEGVPPDVSGSSWRYLGGNFARKPRVYTSAGKIVTGFYDSKENLLNGIYDSKGTMITEKTTSAYKLVHAIFDDLGDFIPGRTNSSGAILNSVYDSQMTLLKQICNSEMLLLKFPSENGKRKYKIFNSQGFPIQQFHTHDGRLLTSIYDFQGSLVRGTFFGNVSMLFPRLFDGNGKFIQGRYDAKGNIIRNVLDPHGCNVVQLYKSDRTAFRKQPTMLKFLNQFGEVIEKFYTKNHSFITHIYDACGNLLCQSIDGNANDCIWRLFDLTGSFISGRLDGLRRCIEAVYDQLGNEITQIKLQNDGVDDMPKLPKLFNRNGQLLVKIFDEAGQTLQAIYDATGKQIARSTSGRALVLATRLFDLAGYFIIGRYDTSHNLIKEIYDHEGVKIYQLFDTNGQPVRRNPHPKKLFTSKGKSIKCFFDSKNLIISSIYDIDKNMIDGVMSEKADELAPYLFDLEGKFINTRYDSSNRAVRHVFDSKRNIITRVISDTSLCTKQFRLKREKPKSSRTVFVKLDCQNVTTKAEKRKSMVVCGDLIHPQSLMRTSKAPAMKFLDKKANGTTSFKNTKAHFNSLKESRKSVGTMLKRKAQGMGDVNKIVGNSHTTHIVKKRKECSSSISSDMRCYKGTNSFLKNCQVSKRTRKETSKSNGSKTRPVLGNNNEHKKSTTNRQRHPDRDTRVLTTVLPCYEAPRDSVKRNGDSLESLLNDYLEDEDSSQRIKDNTCNSTSQEMTHSPDCHDEENLEGNSKDLNVENPYQKETSANDDISIDKLAVCETSEHVVDNKNSKESFLCNLPNAPPFILRMNKDPKSSEENDVSPEASYDTFDYSTFSSIIDSLESYSISSSSTGAKHKSQVRIKTPGFDFNVFVDEKCPDLTNPEFQEFVNNSLMLIRGEETFGRRQTFGSFLSSPTVCLTGLTGCSNNPFRSDETDSRGPGKNNFSFPSTDILFKKNSYHYHSKIPRMLHPGKCKVHSKMKNVQMSSGVKTCAANAPSSSKTCSVPCPANRTDFQINPFVKVSVSTTCPSLTNTSTSGNIKGNKNRNANLQTPLPKSSMGDCVKGIRSDPGCYCGSEPVQTTPCPVRLKEDCECVEEEAEPPKKTEEEDLCYCPPGEQPLLMKKSNIECDCANRRRCEVDTLVEPPKEKPNVFWALTKVSLLKDGTKNFEIIDVSPVPPGYYLMPDVNNLVLVGPQPKPAKPAPSKNCICK